MGCCLSKQEGLYIDVPRFNSTTDTWALRQKSFLGGCKLLPSTASSPVSFPYQTLTRVVLGEDHLFAALWEGHGGSQAARHCVTGCYETLLDCLKTSSDPSQAFKQATQRLDESFFASDIPDIVKAGVGATGVMMYLDTRTNNCCIARMGDSLPFVAESKGSFNTTSIDVKPLSGGRSHRVAFAQLGTRAAVYAVPDPDGPSTYNHAIGLGFGKHKKLQQLWLKQEAAIGLKQSMPSLPFISSSCEVSSTQFAQEDESIILASEGLLEVLPAQELGLLLHHYNAAKLNTLKQTLAAAAAQQEELKAAVVTKGKGKIKPAEEDSQATTAQLPTKANIASIVMHHALSKVIAQFNVAMSRQQQSEGREGDMQELTYEDLARLPLDVDKEAFRPPGDKGSQVKLNLPKNYATGGLCKGDVHGDMGVVVISLNWPRSRDSQPLPNLSPLRPGRTIRPDAQYRWQLLRSSVKFYLAYRRSLRSRWWQVVDDVQTAAEVAARQREVEAWKTKGEAVKINMAGEELNPDAPIRMRHSPAKPLPLATTSVKRSIPCGLADSSSGMATGRVAAAVAAFSTPPSNSKKPAAAPTGSRASTEPRTNSSGFKALTPEAVKTSSHSARDVAAADRKILPGRSSSARSKSSAPASLQISAGYDGGLEESDIDSPQVDSPTKAAAAAKQPFPWESAKQHAAAASPTKQAYNKQSLSLRANRTSGMMDSSVKTSGGSPSLYAEANWSTDVSQASTPQQLSLRAARGLAKAGGIAADASKALQGSPVKGTNRTPSSMSKESSSGVCDISGYQMVGQGSSGRGGSPTKMSRADKISLRPAKPVVR